MVRTSSMIAAATACSLLAGTAAAMAGKQVGSVDGLLARSVPGITVPTEAAFDDRHLQTTTASYNFATQTEIVLCLKAGVAAPVTTPAEVRTAAVKTLGLSPSVDVQVSQTVDKCTANKNWQARISIWNTGSATTSAAQVASAQVDSIYFAQPKFFADMSANMKAAGAAPAPDGADMTMETLGYLVVWLDATAQSADGTTSVGGDSTFMPTWVWALLALVVVFLLVPVAYFCYRRKRDREIESEDAAFAKAHGLPPFDKHSSGRATKPHSDENSPNGEVSSSGIGGEDTSTLHRNGSSKGLLARFGSSKKSISGHSVSDGGKERV